MCTAATAHITLKNTSWVVNSKYTHIWNCCDGLSYNNVLDICDIGSEIITAVNILRCVNGGTALAVKGWCMSLIYVQLVAFDWIFIFPMYVYRLLSSRHHLMISTFTVTARSTWCVWTVSKSFNADLADTCAPIHYYALSAWLNWLQSNLDLLQAEPSNWSHRIKYLTGLMTPRVSGFWQLFSTKRF